MATKQFESGVLFAPSVPQWARRALRECSQEGSLILASDPPPKKVYWVVPLLGSLLRGLAGALAAPVLVYVCMAVGGALVSTPSEDVFEVVDEWADRFQWVFVVAGAAGALWGAVTPWRGVGKERAQQKYHGRYLTADDLDGPACELLTRAAAAVDRVLGSAVHRDGLLDRIGNDVVLPQRLWEIARLLHRQTLLRAEQEAAWKQARSAELEAVTAPQREALRQSEAAVLKQVEELEGYAARVAEVESVYTAQKMLGDNHKYMDLLAATSDEESVAELAAHADGVSKQFTESLREAIEAGQVLALPK